MKEQEFQHKHHEYAATNREDAEAEAVKVNAEAEGFKVRPVSFGSLGFALMLEVAADSVEEWSLNK